MTQRRPLRSRACAANLPAMPKPTTTMWSSSFAPWSASSMLRTPSSRSSGASSRSPAEICGAARTNSGVRNIDRTPAAKSGATAASSITPLLCARRVSTKPNSPNCASPTPASQATRAGKRIAIAAKVASTPLAISTIGTTQRSWKMSAPTMKRPCGASSSRRSASARSTMAVLESANTKP